MTTHDGPLDPFLDDPNAPAALLDETDPAEPLSDEERAAVQGDLDELAAFRQALEARGWTGSCGEFGDCSELHYVGGDLMAANLGALLGEGRPHVHEPAYEPNSDSYVSWD